MSIIVYVLIGIAFKEPTHVHVFANHEDCLSTLERAEKAVPKAEWACVARELLFEG